MHLAAVISEHFGIARSEARPAADGTDRVIALEAIIDAKGNKLPAPPVCHGYANCCRCPVCLLREERRARPALAA